MPREELRTWLLREQQISLIELYAAPVAIATWRPLVTERNILIFADNTSALAALAKGYSPNVGSALTIQDFWTACAREMRRLARPRRVFCQHHRRAKPQQLLADGEDRLHRGSANSS